MCDGLTSLSFSLSPPCFQFDSNTLIENTYSDIYSYYGATEEVPEVSPFTGINVDNVYRCESASFSARDEMPRDKACGQKLASGYELKALGCVSSVSCSCRVMFYEDDYSVPATPFSRARVLLCLCLVAFRKHSNNVVTHLVKTTVDIEDSDGTEISSNTFSGNDNGAHFV